MNSIPCFSMTCEGNQANKCKFLIAQKIDFRVGGEKGVDRFSSPFSELSGSETRAAYTLSISYNHKHTHTGELR